MLNFKLMDNQDKVLFYVFFNGFRDDKEIGRVYVDLRTNAVHRCLPDRLVFEPDFDESVTKLVSVVNDYYEYKPETHYTYTGVGEIIEAKVQDSFYSSDGYGARVKIADVEVFGTLYPAVDKAANEAFNTDDKSWSDLQTQVTWDWAKPGTKVTVDYDYDGYYFRPGEGGEVKTYEEVKQYWVKRG